EKEAEPLLRLDAAPRACGCKRGGVDAPRNHRHALRRNAAAHRQPLAPAARHPELIAVAADAFRPGARIAAEVPGTNRDPLALPRRRDGRELDGVVMVNEAVR